MSFILLQKKLRRDELIKFIDAWDKRIESAKSSIEKSNTKIESLNATIKFRDEVMPSINKELMEHAASLAPKDPLISFTLQSASIVVPFNLDEQVVKEQSYIDNIYKKTIRDGKFELKVLQQELDEIDNLLSTLYEED